MKTIHVELTNKAVDFFVAEVPRQNNFLKFIGILDDELGASGRPEDNFWKFLALK